MKVDELHPIFKECCGDGRGKYDLRKPFARDGYWCATDGRICVRCPAGDATIEVGKGPDLAEVIHRLDTPPFRIPVLGPESPKFCTVCKGYGYTECGECEQDVECVECDGVDHASREEEHVWIGDWGFKRRYLRILKRHGAVLRKPDRKGPETVESMTGRNAPYFTVGKGIDGALMPMAEPE